MTHCDGCAHEATTNACCTLVMARPAEAKAIRHYAREHGVSWQQHEGIRCGFLQDGQCAVYPVRPWVCRAFGVVQQLPCSRFPEDAVIDYSPEQARLNRVADPGDELLGAYFEDGYYERMTVAMSTLAEGKP
jgi:Fe-S-cluster containining protein